MPLRVEIAPRDSCISDMVCVVLCPEVFVIERSDGRAAIRASFRLQESDPSRGAVSSDLAYCVEAAAENCPVEIIRVVRE
ncbi:MAG: ferredoxin [Acidilobaceae archaeon]